MGMVAQEAVISGAIDIFAVLLNLGILILLIYVLFYRIPKALIKYAIRTYFDEKWNMEHRNQQNPQIRY